MRGGGRSGLLLYIPSVMTFAHNRPTRILVPLVAFAAALGVWRLMDRSPAPAVDRPASVDVGAPGAGGGSTASRIHTLQRVARARPHDVESQAALGGAYLQAVRETGDPAYYSRARRVLARALQLGPGNPAALVGYGTLELARHRFAAGLRYGQAAHAAAPALVQPLYAITDGQIELGRYAAAGRTLQRIMDWKPTLAGYARVSYFRELHGDIAGARAAMALAADAGAAAPENLAYVQTLLGNLDFDSGRLAPAARDYRQALFTLPGYPAAEAGTARVDAARRRFGPAIRRYRAVVARLPLPEYVVGLGETELAAGRTAAARRDLALVTVEQRLLAANGVNTDVDLALFDANHGDPRQAVRLARRAWAQAPSVRSADALGWALTRAGHPAAGLAWAHRALSLGSRDSNFLYHAGMSARAAGRRGLARRYLSAALARNPRFSSLYAPRAQRALESP